MAKILVTYGTLTGNTEIVANEIAAVLKEGTGSSGEPFEVDCLDGFTIETSDLASYDLILAGASTWSDGSLNPVSEDFVLRLQTESPDLTAKPVAVFGLGESHYPLFCTAAEVVAETLVERGAQLQGEILKIDGYPTDEVIDEAKKWALTVVSALKFA